MGHRHRNCKSDGSCKRTKFNLLMFIEVAEGHGSAMSIGRFDSSKCKGTPVLDSGLRHDSIAQHRVTDSGFGKLIAGPQ